jgi:hypothetical protein
VPVTSGRAVARYAGRIGDVAVSIVDLRCDSKVLEVTLVGPVDGDLSSLMNLLRRLEVRSSVHIASKLTKQQMIDLSNSGTLEWHDGDESGVLHVIRSDVSIILHSYYRQNF